MKGWPLFLRNTFNLSDPDDENENGRGRRLFCRSVLRVVSTVTDLLRKPEAVPKDKRKCSRRPGTSFGSCRLTHHCQGYITCVMTIRGTVRQIRHKGAQYIGRWFGIRIILVMVGVMSLLLSRSPTLPTDFSESNHRLGSTLGRGGSGLALQNWCYVRRRTFIYVFFLVCESIRRWGTNLILYHTPSRY